MRIVTLLAALTALAACQQGGGAVYGTDATGPAAFSDNIESPTDGLENETTPGM